ncbi:hypothetical protein D3C86_1455190 [compost metagenome]
MSASAGGHSLSEATWYHRDMISSSDVQGQVRFRFGRRDQLVLYKHKDESPRHLLLKAAAYALFYREHELKADAKLRFKHPADLAAVDLTGEPTFWVVVDDLNLARLEYTCRHVHAPVVLVLQEPDLDAVVALIRKNIHYKHTHRHLTVYNFVQPVEDWLDPDQVEIPAASYDVFHF